MSIFIEFDTLNLQDLNKEFDDLCIKSGRVQHQITLLKAEHKEIVKALQELMRIKKRREDEHAGDES